MFKHLKKKFVLIYSISIFILIVFSFSIIFYSSYTHTVNDVQGKLNSKGEQKPIDEGITPNDPNIPNVTLDERNPFEQKQNDQYNIQVFSSDMFFLLDDSQNIIDSASQNELNAEQIKIIQTAIKDKSKTTFKMDDQYFAYNISENVVKVVDITQSFLLLKNLFFILLFSSILIIAISIFIGNWFVSIALKPVEQSYIKQQSFVSDASHELKTPISVIYSCLELIKDKDDESEKWIDYCISETNRLKNLTSDLLTLSVDNSNINIKQIPNYNISEHLELISCAYEAKFFEENFTFTSNIKPNLEVKFLDDDFKQLFHLLIDNAIKYNDNRKKINVSLNKEEKNAIFKISNSTDYISNEELGHIFDRFYRQDQSRTKKIEGFGLGLSLVKNIMLKYKLKYNVQYVDSMFVFSIKIPLED